MRILFSTLAGVLLLSSGALADTAPAAQPAAPQATASNDDMTIVCRYATFQGTVIKRKTCKTQKQWDNDRRSQQQDLNRIQQGGYQQGH
jgi:hypothetical protein